MADLTPEEVKGLGRSVGIDIDEPILGDLANNLNALRDLLASANPPGLEQVEALPIIPPHQRSSHEQG